MPMPTPSTTPVFWQKSQGQGRLPGGSGILAGTTGLGWNGLGEGIREAHLEDKAAASMNAPETGERVARGASVGSPASWWERVQLPAFHLSARLPLCPDASSLRALHGVPFQPWSWQYQQKPLLKENSGPHSPASIGRGSPGPRSPLPVTVKSAGGSGEFVEGSIITEVTEQASHRKSSPQRAPRLMAWTRENLLFFFFSGYLIVLWSCGKELESFRRAEGGKKGLFYFFLEWREMCIKPKRDERSRARLSVSFPFPPSPNFSVFSISQATIWREKVPRALPLRPWAPAAHRAVLCSGICGWDMIMYTLYI